MRQWKTVFCALLLLLSGTAWADGLMRPVATGYPKDFLRVRMTGIEVNIVGQWATTTVYQEFVNEWSSTTDGVYSFPLPADARVSNFYFWAGDTLFKASLKIKEQAPNPGTGEGGIDALLNTYLGANALRVVVNGIPAGGIQRVKLEYISLCDFHDGRVTYRYPFASSTFVQYPLETFSLAVHCTASDPILSDSIGGMTGDLRVTRSAQRVDLELTRSKIYPTGDFSFSYVTATSAMSVDLCSAANDSTDGHFVLMVKPPTAADSASILPKNVIFLLDRSSSTYGIVFDESRAAIKDCLRRLRPGDRFNVIAFNTVRTPWAVSSLPVTTSTIDSASTFLDHLSAAGGSDLGTALAFSLATFPDDSISHAIMVFSDGRSPVDPVAIRALNVGATGIFPVGIGTTVNRERLEMTALQNYGFPTFLAITDPIRGEVVDVFDRISLPLLTDIRTELGGNAYDILPGTLGSLYRGSRYYLTGRYRTPTSTAFSMAGSTVTGPAFFDFSLPMSADTRTYAFASLFWAKEKIDELERREAVYGVSDSLKQVLISLSLRYGIRCKYTSYVADRTHPMTGVGQEQPAITVGYGLLGNYPNPFNPGTNIRFVVRATIKEEVTVRIYNVLGQLIAVLHVHVNGSGQYEVRWEGRDVAGAQVPSGVYYYTVDFHAGYLSGRMLLLR
jgi:Ca-activated chloride channel homolog